MIKFPTDLGRRKYLSFEYCQGQIKSGSRFHAPRAHIQGLQSAAQTEAETRKLLHADDTLPGVA